MRSVFTVIAVGLLATGYIEAQTPSTPGWSASSTRLGDAARRRWVTPSDL
jgi:hypothetical protein